MRIKNISDFLNTDYRDYAISVIEERAIPSVIDSFKPVQRKIIDMAQEIWKTGTEKSMKIFQLCGQCCAKKLYVHGDKSCNDAIITMCQDYKNNEPMLIADGQVGNRFVRSEAAPRYVGCHLSPKFRLYYRDFELLERKIEEGQEIEPKWFLCLIPMVLVNGGSGLAIGHASNILNRNPKDIIDGCIAYLKNKKIKELKPWSPVFFGDYIKDTENSNKWWIKGKYEIINSTNVHITEFPMDYEFEKYENYLDSLVDKKIIKDYDNNSASFVDYTLKFKKEDLQNLVDSNKLESVLKLTSSVVENFTTLDENNKLKIFDSAEEILKYFVDFRLVYYQKRKDYLIDKYKKELTDLCWRAKFIKAIIDKKLVVNNKPKEEIVKWLEENKFEKMNNDYNYLLNMNILSLTKEKYEDLMNKAHQKKEDLNLIEKKEPKEMYLEDLQELKKKI